MKIKKSYEKITTLIIIFIFGVILGLIIGIIFNSSESILGTENIEINNDREAGGKTTNENDNREAGGEAKQEQSESKGAEFSFPIIGNENSKIQITEYTDFQCTHCKDFYENVFDDVFKELIEENKIGYTIKDFPLQQHKNNINASLAVHCAREQNFLLEMIDKAFREQDSWAESQTPNLLFKNFAHQLNLNEEDFSKCLESEEKLQIIQEGINSATKEKLHSTPTIFINENKIEGLHPKEYYQEILNIELNKISEKSE